MGSYIFLLQTHTRIFWELYSNYMAGSVTLKQLNKAFYLFELHSKAYVKLTIIIRGFQNTMLLTVLRNW